MRIAFFLLFILCFSTPILSQLPTAKEIEAQKQEAIKDVKQQITVLEKEIAESKAKNEDPDSIKEMEKQLEALKQMVGILEKTMGLSTKSRSIPEVKTVIPKYVSPIVPIVLKQQVAAPTEAQAKDELLWYKGKKLNDSMIVTTQGTVVLYSRRRNMVIVQPDKKKDTTFRNIAANLGKCRQWTTQYVENTAATKNIFFEYPEIMMHIKEFNFLEETYRDIIKNTIDLPMPENTVAWFSADKKMISGPSSNTGYSSDPNDFLKILYKNMMDHWMKISGRKFSPSPNRRLWDICTTCNEQEFEVYRKDMKQWQEDFIEFSTTLLEKMSAVKVWMAKEGITYATSGIPTLEKDLKGALEYAFTSWDSKLYYLEHYYASGWEPLEMDVVFENILLIQSQKKNYYGFIDESYTTRLKNALTDYEKRITDRYEFDMANKSYSSVLNTRLIYAYDRHYKLLFGSSVFGATNVSSPLQNLLEKIKRFNRFSLTIDLDFQIEMKKDATRKIIEADGKLSNSDKVYVSLGKAKDCKWQLYLTNTEYTNRTRENENSFRIPIKINSGTKYTFLEPRDVVMASYSGPTDMLLVFPYNSIDFCQNRGNFSGTFNPDTIILESLRYRQEDLSQYGPGSKNYSVDLLQYVNKMFLSVEQTAEVHTDLLMTANEMMTVAIMGRVDKPTGFPKLDQIQIEFKKNGEQRVQQKLLASKTHFGNTVMLFTTGSQDFINVTRSLTNTELFGGYNLNKGNITLKIIHDPQ